MGNRTKVALAPDFNVTDCGSVAIVWPLSRRCRVWVDEHVDVHQSWGTGFAVEHRYVGGLVAGLIEAGFEYGEAH